MIDKIKHILNYLNEHGVAVPLARDHGRASVSLTLLFISSLFVILGLLSETLPGLNVNFYEALMWHVTSAVLYYNRGAKISKDGFELNASNENKSND